MIELIKLNNEEPYSVFVTLLDNALNNGQDNTDAISISSFNPIKKEVQSRYVNLKSIRHNKWTFFSNYDSPKSKSFLLHDQIAALFYWSKTDTQIRIKAKIYKTSEEESNNYFKARNKKKNALSISSMQSKNINSYEEVTKSYNHALSSKNLHKRPEYWGGFFFIPYYFEFWEGHESRINKRVSYEAQGSEWKKNFLQP